MRGEIEAPDLYRVKGSLPIPNHTMQGVTASIGGVAVDLYGIPGMRLKDGDSKTGS